MISGYEGFGRRRLELCRRKQVLAKSETAVPEHYNISSCDGDDDDNDDDDDDDGDDGLGPINSKA